MASSKPNNSVSSLVRDLKPAGPTTPPRSRTSQPPVAPTRRGFRGPLLSTIDKYVLMSFLKNYLISLVVLVGLCSGLKSIVQGTVPLVLFGPKGFGSRLGFMAGFRYASGALAPFLFSFVSGLTSASAAALVFAALGMLGVLALWLVTRLLQPAAG